jgi:hypothetical protein
MIRPDGRQTPTPTWTPYPQVAPEARLDSSGNGRTGRPGQVFSCGCRAGQAEYLDSESLPDREGVQENTRAAFGRRLRLALHLLKTQVLSNAAGQGF